MRSLLFFYLLVALLVGTLVFMSVGRAQARDRKFGYGVKVGMNVADYTNSRGTPRYGLYGGAFCDYNFARVMGMEVGAYYSQQGSNSVSESGYIGFTKHKLDYLLVPIHFKYYLIPRFRLFAGVQAGFLLSANRNYKTQEGWWSVEKMRGVRSYDLAVEAGVGYTFGFGLDLGVGFTYGLSDLKITDAANHTSMVRVTAGWRF